MGANDARAEKLLRILGQLDIQLHRPGHGHNEQPQYVSRDAAHATLATALDRLDEVDPN